MCQKKSTEKAKKPNNRDYNHDETMKATFFKSQRLKCWEITQVKLK